mmetsp:Transcript_6644/g.19257  ORF Transcript_6644/g.19257 Transcript_6644/m.19257 type:complete len:147 (-) Transcript_6644:276-716(-)
MAMAAILLMAMLRRGGTVEGAVGRLGGGGWAADAIRQLIFKHYGVQTQMGVRMDFASRPGHTSSAVLPPSVCMPCHACVGGCMQPAGCSWPSIECAPFKDRVPVTHGSLHPIRAALKRCMRPRCLSIQQIVHSYNCVVLSALQSFE